MRKLLKILVYPWEIRKKRKEELEKLLAVSGLKLVKRKNTSIVLGCLVTPQRDNGTFDVVNEVDNTIIYDTGLTYDDAAQKVAKYNLDAKKTYPKLSGDEALSRHMDDVLEIKNLEKRVITSKNQLVDFIEGLRTKRKDIRPTAGNIIEGKNILSFAHNIKNTNLDTVIEGFHPLVRDWVKWAQKNASWKLPKHHGLCAEIVNISKILWKNDKKGKYTLQQAQELFEGAISNAKKIRGKNSSANGEFIEACDSCKPFLKYFNITEVK